MERLLEDVPSLLLSTVDSLPVSSRDWHPPAPHPPIGSCLLFLPWTHSTEGTEGPGDSRGPGVSSGPCRREKGPQPSPSFPKQGPQPLTCFLSGCYAYPSSLKKEAFRGPSDVRSSPQTVQQSADIQLNHLLTVFPRRKAP